MNYLQIVQQASGELGLAVPNQVAGNNAADVIQIGALLSGIGQSIARDFDWQALQKEYRFLSEVYTSPCVATTDSAIVTGLTSTATLARDDWMATGTGVSQDVYILSIDSLTQVTLTRPITEDATDITFCKTRYAMPTDCKRITPRTQWDKTAHWCMIGPANAEEWQAMKGGFAASAVRRYFRVMGNKFQIFPPSASAVLLGFEYLSRSWVIDRNGAPAESFVNDLDTCIFDDRMMVTGLKAMYFGIKGFDTTRLDGEFNRMLEVETGADKVPQMLSLGGRRGGHLIDYSNVPDTGYGATR
jgi:hypothetical protein